MDIDYFSSFKFVFISTFLISLLTSNPELSALILSGAYLYLLGHHANMTSVGLIIRFDGRVAVLTNHVVLFFAI